MVSDAGGNGAYTLGEEHLARLTFEDTVEVEGAPRLKIDLDPANCWEGKWATYESGIGADQLTLAYQVVGPNPSTQGIAALADTLELNDGAIRSASSGYNAALEHTDVDHDANHMVDWQVQNSPAVGTPTIMGAAREGETLAADISAISDADGLENRTLGYQWIGDDGGVEAFQVQNGHVRTAARVA